jgi:hypothetical protein
VAQFRQHLFEPGAVTTGFKGHDYLTSKLLVERAHIIMLMPQLPAINLAIGQITVTNRLFTRMKINCDVYCHRAPPFVIRKSTGLEFTKTRGGRCLFMTSENTEVAQRNLRTRTIEAKLTAGVKQVGYLPNSGQSLMGY